MNYLEVYFLAELNNNINWSLINSTNFEKLALEYANHIYSAYNWKQTKKSWDGNKDFYIVSTNTFNDGNHVWGEAKYSKKEKSVESHRLDPTIVSAIIADNVVLILFISNVHFSNNYLLRGEKIFCNGLRRIQYFDKEDLEPWLLNSPELYSKYFKSEHPKRLINNPQNSFAITESAFSEIIDFQNGLIASKNKMDLKDDYILILFLKSKFKNIQLRVQENQGLPFYLTREGKDALKDNYLIYPGLQVIYFRITPQETGYFKECILNFTFEDDQVFSYPIPEFEITDSFRPKLSFDAQGKIEEEIHSNVLATSEGRGIITVFAPGGSGKSYLFNNIILNHGHDFDIFRIEFTLNEAANAILICKLLLYLGFGTFYTLDMDSLISNFNNMKHLPNSILETMGTAIKADGGAPLLALDVLKQLTNLVKNQKHTLINSISFKGKRLILIEDIQKLDGDANFLLKTILKEHVEFRHPTLFILAGREDEIKPKNFKDMINKCSVRIFHLQELTSDDVMNSLKSNLNIEFDETVILKLIASMNRSPLYIEKILLDLNNNQTDFDNNSLDFPPHVINVIEKNKIQSVENHYREKLLSLKSYYDLLDIIYAIESGITKDVLIHHFGEKIERKIEFLQRNAIIKMVSGGILNPSHDIYLNEYQKIRGEELHSNNLAVFVLFCLKHSYMERYFGISLLIKCGDKYKNIYLKMGRELRDQLYESTQFGAALSLAENIHFIEKEEITNSNLGYNELNSMFIYADCLNHCSSIEKSKSTFDKVYKIGKRSLSVPSERGIIFEAKAEVFNIKYWQLKMNEIEIKSLVEFISELRTQLQSNDDPRYVNAYLTANNRLMTCMLLLDNYDEAKKLFHKNLDYSKQFTRPDCEGNAYMDYAKGIYHQNPKEALQFLEIAYEIFRELKTQKRREIDCHCEINFIRQMLFHNNMKELVASSFELKTNNFNNQYVKSLLKVAACKLIEPSPCLEDILMLISDAIVYSIMKNKDYSRANPRLSATIANLYAILACFDPAKNRDLKSKSELQLKYLNGTGHSYKKIPEQNKKNPKGEVAWFMESGNNNNKKLLEPRIW